MFSLTSDKDNIRCFLDLDGCTVNWLDAACKSCGADPEEKSLRDKLKKGQNLDVALGVPEEDIWRDINKNSVAWWTGLKELPWARKLVKSLKPFDPCFLSSPGKKHKTAAIACHGKALWLEEHFPDMPYFFAYKKEMVASSASILIDDQEKKVKLFESNGGNVFHWKNQYKFIDGDLDVDEEIEKLVKMIKDLS